YITHGIHKVSGSSDQSHDHQAPQENQDEELGGSESTSQSPLENFASNLNEAAMQRRIDPVVGREFEVERVCQILVRRRKNNPLLVRASGVGKTALAEELAQRIVDGDVPATLADSVV